MKKMRLVFALALAGLTALTAQASPVDNEEAVSIADVAPPIMEFVEQEVFIQPEINVISAPSTGGTWYSSYGVGMSVSASEDFFIVIAAEEPASNSVPEPATLLLVGLGMAGLAVRRKRQK